MNKNRTQQQLYIIFWIIIVILIGLIGWFTYLLIQPNDSDRKTTTNTNVVTDNSNTNAGKKSKKNKNTNATEVNTTATNTDAANTNSTTTNSDTTTDGGLVEPAEGTKTGTETDATANDAGAETDQADATDETAADDESKQIVTLYFPKTNSDCGEVYPVERTIEPSDDPYGQIILETMHGPTDEESGYSNAVPSGLYLRRVEYTATGALITVSEAYDTLDSCEQATASAQLIETANAMFELPEGTAGEVVVGTVSDDADDTTSADETDTDSE